MSKPTPFKMICPFCKKTTEMMVLKNLNKDEYKKEIDWFTNNIEDMIQPELTREFYDLLQNRVNDELTTEYTVGKIKPHKLGLFDKNCSSSNKSYKILFYYFINHKEQLGGVTFRIGQEIKYPVEHLAEAEKLAKYCTTLNKEGICVVLGAFSESKKFTVTGDLAMFYQIRPEIWGDRTFQIIAADSTLSPNELKKFIVLLANKLGENNMRVRVSDKDSKIFQIDCFKHNEWIPCVAIAPKGYQIQ